MITSHEFDLALKIIVGYKAQLENVRVENKIEVDKIDIQNKINKNTYFILQNYYRDEFNVHIEFEDLKAMDVKFLKSIDYKKMHRYRGFGKVAEFRFKEILESCSV
jgi:hypothetical protein